MKNTFTIDDAIGQCEAAAAALEKGYHDPDGNWCKCASIAAENRQMAEWLRELKKLKSEDSWITCREKQPDKTGQYLVTIKYRHDKKGYMYMTARRNYYAEYQTWEDSLVIAWQPLPEPYRAESEE